MEWLKAWVHETAECVRFDALPEKFHVDDRLGHWNGPLGPATPARISLEPLLSSAAVKRNFELSFASRIQERLHFEVMSRTAPELVAAPFFNDAWSPEITTDTRHAFAPAVQHTGYTEVGAQWQQVFLENERRAIKRLFTDAARKTAMADICDMRKLKRVASSPAQLKKVQTREVITSIGVALLLLGRGEPDWIGRRGTTPSSPSPDVADFVGRRTPSSDTMSAICNPFS